MKTVRIKKSVYVKRITQKNLLNKIKNINIKMNYFEEWYQNHKKYTIRPYADRILNKELPKAFKKSNIAVLAACPNSGKTLMAIAWMENYLSENPNHRILVLTHGQSVLRQQFYNDIESAHVNFTYEKVEKSKNFITNSSQVVVTLPNTIVNSLNNTKNTFNVLIVDEAHHYYYAKNGMVGTIIKHYGFQKQLLLTGTPAPFIANKRKIIALPLEELIDSGYASDPIVVMSNGSYHVNSSDFNSNNELKESYELNTELTFSTLENLIKTIVEEILNKESSNSIESLGKTLIFTKNINQANDVLSFFENKGIKALKSTSKDDLNSKNLKSFEEGDVNILIVVDRAVLGFNVPKLITVIDMKCGKNISNLFQMFNRITRLHPDKGVQKYYIKIIPENDKNDYLLMMSAALSLMKKENYIKYNGTSNENELLIPVIDLANSTTATTTTTTTTTNPLTLKSFKFKPINYINVPVSSMWKSNKSITWNTLGNIKRSISNIRCWESYTKYENYDYCKEKVKYYYDNNVVKVGLSKIKELHFIYDYLIKNKLAENIYNDLNLKIKNSTDNYYTDSIRICNQKNYKNITAFKNENRTLYNYLKSKKKLNKFKDEVGIKSEKSVEKCVELFWESPDNFKSKYPKEYSWLKHNKKIKVFNEIIQRMKKIP